MTATEPVRAGFVSQMWRFVAVGTLCAIIDYAIYLGLFNLGVWVHGAKGISFIIGTTCAYLLNRRFTFDSEGGVVRFAGFMLLYGTTFFLNVGTNGLMLTVLPEEVPFHMTVAFVIAQGVATTINFLMQRMVIFRH